MKKNKFLALVATSISIFVFSGCVMCFAPRYQKVTIKSNTPDATIVVADDTVGKNSAVVTCDKNTVVIGGKLEKDGYKTRHYCFQLTKLSPYFGLIVLDAAVMIPAVIAMNAETPGWSYPGTLLIGSTLLLEYHSSKAHKFAPMQLLPPLLPLEKRLDDQKFILVDNTDIDAKPGDVSVRIHKSIEGYLKSLQNETFLITPKQERIAATLDLKIEQTNFSRSLNRTLVKLNFIDTDHQVFSNMGNTLYLDAKIKKATLNVISPPYGAGHGTANKGLSIDLSIEWKVMDYYKQTLLTVHTQKQSDLFTFAADATADQKANCVSNVIQDNLEYALMDVRKEIAEKGLLKVSNEKTEVFDAIELTKPELPAGAKMESFYKSTVTVKTEDGHGSGVVVSADGYIVTNYHVVSGAKKIEIIFNDTSKIEAEVVRKNGAADMALLKVKKTDLVPMLFSQETDPDIGVDVFAVGTPKNIELGQSISKGIISGIRKTNGLIMLQTDASINGGNSGGPLVDKQGAVLGIISSKLVGYGAEGIGFALISTDVMTKLGLRYK